MLTQELKDKWLAALKSGKYPKGKQMLRDSEGRFCCLGVLACEMNLPISEDGRGIVCTFERADEYQPFFDLLGVGEAIALYCENDDSKAPDFRDVIPLIEALPVEGQP